MTPSGIEQATSRIVAQYLNHCATAVPPYIHIYVCVCMCVCVYVCERERTKCTQKTTFCLNITGVNFSGLVTSTEENINV
jgi:hypothetical protein